MAQTQLATRDAKEYIAAVRRELADVPWRRRDELLATVRESVDELPENAMASVRFGPPKAYARDLRESVGLPPRSRSPLTLLRAMRLRTLVIAGAATIVVVALIAGSVYRAHYQPTTAYASFGSSDARVIDDPLVSDTLFYRYEPGKVVVTGAEVHNSGWATVHVDRAELPSGSNGPLVVRELRATTDLNVGGNWQRVPKVDRVSVAPGQSVYVVVVMEIANLGTIGRGTRLTVAQPNLRTRVLGVEHTVPMQGDDISLVGPA
jgi:hypothetical protein